MNPRPIIILILFGVLTYACKNEEAYVWKKLEVQASAYNSVPSQTDRLPSLAAWGDTLKPGMNCIAVSQDLIALGLDYGTQIKINGFDSIFTVKDKMHSKWNSSIDIYMGVDVEKAKEWGRKKILIEYRVKRNNSQKLEK